MDFGYTLGGTQELLLVLCSRLTFDSAQESICNVRNGARIGCMQGKHFNPVLSLQPRFSYFNNHKINRHLQRKIYSINMKYQPESLIFFTCSSATDNRIEGITSTGREKRLPGGGQPCEVTIINIFHFPSL